MREGRGGWGGWAVILLECESAAERVALIF
jgi:hypothetical protein